MKKRPYIPLLPGHIKKPDDTRTNVLEALDMTLQPMTAKNYNDGYNDPPIAALQIDGEQYSLGELLENLGEKLKELTDSGIKRSAISSETPSITGVANTVYACGEVSTLSITPPETGDITVRFTSGETPTVLTVPAGILWPTDFDPTDLDVDTIYELKISDATYGSVTTWAVPDET